MPTVRIYASDAGRVWLENDDSLLSEDELVVRYPQTDGRIRTQRLKPGQCVQIGWATKLTAKPTYPVAPLSGWPAVEMTFCDPPRQPRGFREVTIDDRDEATPA
jgi:hypothetical protein